MKYDLWDCFKRKSRVEEKLKRFSMIIVPNEVVHCLILSAFQIMCLKFSIIRFFLSQNKQWIFDHRETLKGFKSIKQEMDWEQTQGREGTKKGGSEEGLVKCLSSPSCPHRLWRFSFSCARILMALST